MGLSPPKETRIQRCSAASPMATIKARRQATGSIRYTAIVRKRVGAKIVHREAKTFTHRTAALS